MKKIVIDEFDVENETFIVTLEQFLDRHYMVHIWKMISFARIPPFDKSRVGK